MIENNVGYASLYNTNGIEGEWLKVFYDAEFTGLHQDTSLISIGLISESGAYFYAEFTDYDPAQVNEWIKENVIDKLIFAKDIRDTFVYHQNIPESCHINDDVNYNVRIKGSCYIVGIELKEWLKNESEIANKQIQFYTDCYAYDWVLLNDLICDAGEALNLPEYLYYIPVDLSTALFLKGFDPDITREEFVYPIDLHNLYGSDMFKDFGSDIKHNSLWDAAICKECFHRIFHPNKRVYDRDAVIDAINNSPVVQEMMTNGTRFVGEMDHPESK